MGMLHYGEFAAAGIVALYDEAPGGGDPYDINSLRNRPALHPEDWLANVYLHSSLDNMEVAFDETTSVSHGSIAAAAGGLFSGGDAEGEGAGGNFATAPVDHLLFTHDLGYLPHVYVAVGDDLITPGYLIQTSAGGDARFVSVYVTTTAVYLRECVIRNQAGLGSLSQDYRVLVIGAQPAPSGNKLREFVAATGQLTLARGRFDNQRRYLQVVPGGSPFGLAMGRSLDLSNGTVRFVAPDGSIYDPTPADMRIRLSGLDVANGPWGDFMAYDGTFTGDPSILVQAP